MKDEEGTGKGEGGRATILDRISTGELGTEHRVPSTPAFYANAAAGNVRRKLRAGVLDQVIVAIQGVPSVL
jgi:hypothetical protein